MPSLPSLRSLLCSRTAAAVLLTLASSWPGLAAPSTSSGRYPGIELSVEDTIGICVKFGQGEDMARLPRLLDLRVKWVKEEEYWDRVESTPGEFKFSERFHERLEFYRKHDIGVLFIVCYGNPKAYPEDPYSPDGYARFALQSARLLEKAGVRYVLELWNEPHNFGLGPDLGGNKTGEPPSPWADKYIAMVHAATTLVKREMPHVDLIVDEDMISAHYWFMQRGLPTGLSGASIHPYVHKPTVGPEQMHFRVGDEHMGKFDLIDENGSLRSMVRRLERAYDKALGHEPLIWSTEVGYRVGNRNQHHSGVITEESAAALLPRAYMNGAAAGLQTSMWYCSQDLPDEPGWGLAKNDGTERLTYKALKHFSERMRGAYIVRQLLGAKNTTKGVQAYLLRVPMGYLVMAWSVDGTRRVTLESGSSAPLRIFSHLGEAVSKQFISDGPPYVEIGMAPIYITGLEADALLTVLP